MQVPPSLLKYPGGNGGLNPLFGPQQVAVLKQLSQFSQLSQLNPISQLQVKWWTVECTTKAEGKKILFDFKKKRKKFRLMHSALWPSEFDQGFL